MLPLAAAGIFVVALCVRFYGLSHDLDEGNVYDPDTPKQVRAAECFVKGYYWRSETGDPGLDGYPYFSMHLVEYEWRIIAGVRAGLQYVMGWRRDVAPPYEDAELGLKLFVLARVNVCVLSALAVLAIYWIGRETWGPLVGLLGAGLAALSPLNVETAHYVMSDSVMDLFACLTVLVAMRMYRSSRVIYVPLAGFLGALTFAAKYNGGMVLVFVALLHVLKHASLRRLFSPQAIRDAGLLAAGVLVGLVVAIPTLLICPDQVVKDIIRFVRHASQFRELPAEAQGGWWPRLQYAAGLNFPLFVRCAGWIVPIGAAVGFILSAFRDRRHVLIGLFPLLYLIVVFAGARVIKPYYFSVAILFFCLYVAAVPAWLAGVKSFRRPGLALGLALVVAALVMSAVSVARGDFFFWHMSSRRVATAWVNENIPQLFEVQEGDCSLLGARRPREKTVEVLAIASSNIRPTNVPDGSVLLKQFELEKEPSVTSFRNPSVSVFLLPGSSNLRDGFSMPTDQRVPSDTGNEYVFPLGAEFLRTGRLATLSPRTLRRVYVIPGGVEEVVVGVRNGNVVNVATFSFGGRMRRVTLESLETRVVVVKDLRCMGLIGRPFYKFWARAPFPCQVEVAVTNEQKGVLYYHGAQYRKALPYLVAAWRERPTPVRAQMAVIAAACSGVRPAELDDGAIANAVREDLEAANKGLFERFGVSSLYVDNLPYVAEEVENLAEERNVHDPRASGDACLVMGPDPVGQWRMALGSFFLEPGWYRVVLTARVEEPVPDEAPATLSFVDATGQVVHDSTTFLPKELVGSDYREVERSLRVTERLGPVSLRIATEPSVRLRLDRFTIRPDVAREIEARDGLARALLDGQLADLRPEPQQLEPLLAYGNCTDIAADPAGVAAAYEKAAEADPASYKPYAVLKQILDRLPAELGAATAARLKEVYASRSLARRRNVSVHFKNGPALAGYRLSGEEFAPGEQVRLTFFWRVVPEEVQRYRGLWVFIHFVPQDAAGHKPAFQGDTGLVSSLRFNERLDRLEPIFAHVIQVGQDVAPGTYDIEVGLLIKQHDKRIRILKADVPHANNSATIGHILIVPPRAPGTD
jgi:hypothetical protein